MWGGKGVVFTPTSVYSLPHMFLFRQEALACVLAHEVGHLVARHPAEKFSRATIMTLILLLLDAFNFPIGPAANMMCNLMFGLPNSRQLETEADVSIIIILM